MVSKVIDSIAEILSECFPDTEIYTENAEQGLHEPCFFVYPVNISLVRHIGRRWLEEYFMCVQYIPLVGDEKAECAKTEEMLYRILEYITVDGAKIAAVSPHSENTDEVLSFFVSYRVLTLESPEEITDTMDSYTQNTIMKE